MCTHRQVHIDTIIVASHPVLTVYVDRNTSILLRFLEKIVSYEYMSVSVCALYKHVPKKLRKKALVPLKLEFRQL